MSEEAFSPTDQSSACSYTNNLWEIKSRQIAHNQLQVYKFCNEEKGGAKSAVKRQKIAQDTLISRYSIRWVMLDDLHLTQDTKQSRKLISVR